jgi:hypothetical protein
MSKETKQRYLPMATNVWSRYGYDFFMSNYIESLVGKHVKPKQDILNSFTPVILAGGENTRLGEVPKPLQPIIGVPAVARLIGQLKSTGFQGQDIYVATRLNFEDPYQTETFWYFDRGEGKNLGVNNNTFHDEGRIGRAGVVKRFADGEIEEAVQTDSGWKFVLKRPKLKKNLLVLHADNIFYSDAPIRWCVERGGEVLNDEAKGYCIFNMQKIEDWDSFEYRKAVDYELEKISRNLDGYDLEEETKAAITAWTTDKTLGADKSFVVKNDICAYAIDREACSKVVMPKDTSKVSISNFICKEIEKSGKGGQAEIAELFFFNINNMELYNTALFVEAQRRLLCDIDDVVHEEGEINPKEFDRKAIERISRRSFNPFSCSAVGGENTQRGVWVEKESRCGVKDYMKNYGMGKSIIRRKLKNDQISIPWTFTDEIMYNRFCFFLGVLTGPEKKDVFGRALRIEAEERVASTVESENSPEFSGRMKRMLDWARENIERYEGKREQMADHQ